MKVKILQDCQTPAEGGRSFTAGEEAIVTKRLGDTLIQFGYAEEIKEPAVEPEAPADHE